MQVWRASSNTMVHLTEPTKKIRNSGVTPCQGHFRDSKLKSSSKTKNLQACHSCGTASHSRSKCNLVMICATTVVLKVTCVGNLKIHL